MRNKFLFTSIFAIGLMTLSQGTVGSNETEHSFQLHRRLISSLECETPHRIHLSDTEITEIKDGNMNSLEQKLNALDVRKERQRYGYALPGGVTFDDDRLVIASVLRQEHATFRPIEITENGELKLQIIDPKITSEVYCFMRAISIEDNRTAPIYHNLSEDEVSVEHLYTVKEMITLLQLDGFDLALDTGKPLIFDGMEIYVSNNTDLPGLIFTLLKAHDIADQHNISVPKTLRFIYEPSIKITNLNNR